MTSIANFDRQTFMSAPLTPPTPQQDHAAAVSTASVAAREGWTRAELADVLAMLGLK